jgi:DNA-binding transcriptional ArsR family regulator
MREGNVHKALSSPMRKEIILFLGSGKRYLSEIAEHIDRTPQTVDFHLSILINSGFVKSFEEEGKKFYELKDKGILKFVYNRKPLPLHHHPKPPHEIVLDIKDELNERMDRIEKKLDKLLEKN